MLCLVFCSWDLTSIASSYLGPAPFAANSIASEQTSADGLERFAS